MPQMPRELHAISHGNGGKIIQRHGPVGSNLVDPERALSAAGNWTSPAAFVNTGANVSLPRRCTHQEERTR